MPHALSPQLLKPMKLRRTLFTLFMISAFALSVARADDASTHAKILKERDAILSQILAGREARMATGGVDDNDIFSARLALITFRRDTAPTQAEKIKQQELIVELHGKKVAALEQRAKIGVVRHEDVLLATDAWLQARQLLEELRRDPKKA